MNILTYWQLKKTLRTHPQGIIVILTGAGISAESGLQTFRGNGGLWNETPIEEVCRPESFKADPQRVLEFYNQRRKELLNQIHPNPAHLSLMALESIVPEVYVITQNVDNLHEEAGTKNLYHIHGQLLQNKCEDCKQVTYSEQPISFPNQCLKCKSYNSLRPNVVFFKEAPYYMKEVESLINMAQVFISIGTSGQVYPAAGFVRQAKKQGALTIEINPNPSGNKHFDFILKGKASEEVPKLVQTIIKEYQK